PGGKEAGMIGLVLNACVAPGWTLSLRLLTVASATADAIVPSVEAMNSTAPVDLTAVFPALAMLSGTAAALPGTAAAGAVTPPAAAAGSDALTWVTRSTPETTMLASAVFVPLLPTSSSAPPWFDASAPCALAWNASNFDWRLGLETAGPDAACSCASASAAGATRTSVADPVGASGS